jgi:hypothetical protein
LKRAFAALTLLVAGCALLQPEAEPSRQLREIVGETVEAVRANSEEQRRRLAQARRQYDAMPNESNGVRYAALLANLPPPWRDDQKATELLGPLAAQQPASPLTRLADMLLARVTERQRLAQDLRAVEKRAEAAVQRAEAAAQRAEAAQQRAESAERREESANQRANTLQGQVEALKSIERGILQREERRRINKR